MQTSPFRTRDDTDNAIDSFTMKMIELRRDSMILAQWLTDTYSSKALFRERVAFWWWRAVAWVCDKTRAKL